MDYIVAASNLRAENYEIAPADRHKVITFTLAPHQIPARCCHQRGTGEVGSSKAERRRCFFPGVMFLVFSARTCPEATKAPPPPPIVAGAELITALYLLPER